MKSNKKSKNKKNTVISKHVNSPNKQKIEEKGVALKRDWRNLTDDAKYARLDEISKLGCSNRRLAKAIGVSEKTIRNCLNKHRSEKNEAPETVPNKSANPEWPSDSTTTNTMAVVEQTNQTSKPALIDAEKPIFAKKFKLNLSALDIKPKLDIPPQSGPPATKEQATNKIELSDPPVGNGTSSTAGRTWLQNVEDDARRSMAERYRVEFEYYEKSKQARSFKTS